MRRALTIVLALALAACSQPKPITARPALWRATNGPVTLWLFGTIHLLPRDVAWASPAIDRAVAESGALVTEVPDGGDPAAQAATFLKYGRAVGLPPAAKRVLAARRSALAQAIAAAGVSAAMLDGLKSWAAAVTLSVGASRALGASTDYGVERVLAQRFAGRPRQALETLDGQLALLDSLPEPAQRVLLDAAIDDATGAQAAYRATLDAWASGDSVGIARTFDTAFGRAPALQQVLVAQRNRRWADRLAAEPRGTYLVAVGAGHMVGADALPALLNARGFRVARVQ